MEEVTAYKTNDGKIFATKEGALTHECTQTFEKLITSFARNKARYNLDGDSLAEMIIEDWRDLFVIFKAYDEDLKRAREGKNEKT